MVNHELIALINEELKEKLNDENAESNEHLRTLISMVICSNMFDQNFTLDQIKESMPWLSKSDILGFSQNIGKSVAATNEELISILREYRRTGTPAVLASLFDTPEAQARRRFRVRAICPDCREEHISYDIKLSDEELQQLDDFAYRKRNVPSLYLLLTEAAPVVTTRAFICPICKKEFTSTVGVYIDNEII